MAALGSMNLPTGDGDLPDINSAIPTNTKAAAKASAANEKYLSLSRRTLEHFAGETNLFDHNQPQHTEGEFSQYIRDALAEMASYIRERPNGVVRLAGMLRRCDTEVRLERTSRSQIGRNLAAVDGDGQIRKYFEYNEVMRAVGVCVMRGLRDLGYVKEESRKAKAKGEEGGGRCVVC